jgi:hypothetical protein
MPRNPRRVDKNVWVIRLEKNLLTVAGQRRIYTDFPHLNYFFNIKLWIHSDTNYGLRQLTTLLQGLTAAVILQIWNIGGLAVQECMSQK